MRASAVVKRQLTVPPAWLRVAHQALTSRFTVSISGNRRLKHWRANTLNSHSAIFNQLPCFGVYTNSNLSSNARATCGANTLYNDAPQWVLRLSITRVIRLASGKSSSSSRRTPRAHSPAAWLSATCKCQYRLKIPQKCRLKIPHLWIK